MSDLVFKSSLTMDEIEENFKGSDLFSEILKSLQETLAYEINVTALPRLPESDTKLDGFNSKSLISYKTNSTRKETNK